MPIYNLKQQIHQSYFFFLKSRLLGRFALRQKYQRMTLANMYTSVRRRKVFDLHLLLDNGGIYSPEKKFSTEPSQFRLRFTKSEPKESPFELLSVFPSFRFASSLYHIYSHGPRFYNGALRKRGVNYFWNCIL